MLEEQLNTLVQGRSLEQVFLDCVSSEEPLSQGSRSQAQAA